jgi:hypothetical protein
VALKPTAPENKTGGVVFHAAGSLAPPLRAGDGSMQSLHPQDLFLDPQLLALERSELDVVWQGSVGFLIDLDFQPGMLCPE